MKSGDLRAWMRGNGIAPTDAKLVTDGTEPDNMIVILNLRGNTSLVLNRLANFTVCQLLSSSALPVLSLFPESFSKFQKKFPSYRLFS